MVKELFLSTYKLPDNFGEGRTEGGREGRGSKVLGGAEEAAYGQQCLDYLLRAPDGTPLRPDVLMFNWADRAASGGECGE